MNKETNNMIVDNRGYRLCDPKCELFIAKANYCMAGMLSSGWDKPEYIIDAHKTNYCNVTKGYKLIKDEETTHK